MALGSKYSQIQAKLHRRCKGGLEVDVVWIRSDEISIGRKVLDTVAVRHRYPLSIHNPADESVRNRVIVSGCAFKAMEASISSMSGFCLRPRSIKHRVGTQRTHFFSRMLFTSANSCFSFNWLPTVAKHSLNTGQQFTGRNATSCWQCITVYSCLCWEAKGTKVQSAYSWNITRKPKPISLPSHKYYISNFNTEF